MNGKIQHELNLLTQEDLNNKGIMSFNILSEKGFNSRLNINFLNGSSISLNNDEDILEFLKQFKNSK